jgi:spermidine synthase
MSGNRLGLAILVFSGIFYGLAYTAGLYLRPASGAADGMLMRLLPGLAWVVAMPMILFVYRERLFRHVVLPLEAVGIAGTFRKYEPFTYLLALASIAFTAGVRPSLAFTLAVCVSIVLAQAVLFLAVLQPAARARLARTERYIACLFLISGVAALMYQVVWQRTLFTLFGTNTESVTVIVSVFMLGLGVGSLAGGYIQERFPDKLLRLFLLVEILIGLYGLCSLPLIRTVAEASVGGSTVSLIVWAYALLAIPTLLMGATLPILVSFLQKHLRNIGKTVGLLYAFNTFGSAIAAFLTVMVLFVFIGQQATILVAAACNFITALLIFDAARKLARTADGPVIDLRETPGAAAVQPRHLPYWLAFAVVLAIGYISLSQEILWYRLLGYLTANRPEVFGLMLTAFLIGIASGSLRAKRICESGADPVSDTVKVLAIAAVVFYLSAPAVSWASAFLTKGGGQLLAYAAVGVVSFLTGGVLPSLIHAGVDAGSPRAELRVAWLYFANIIGSTLGPLLTGFVLLDRFPLHDNILILTGLMLLLLVSLLHAMPAPAARKLGMLAGAVVAGAVFWLAQPFLFHGYLERIQFQAADHPPFKYVLENRSAILSVDAGEADTMYGNGAYDGLFATDPVANENLIDRAFMIAALHREPRRVLELGLSTASWTKVMSGYAPLEQLRVVEINEGYREIVRHYPLNASVFADPKVVVTIDDARRWLNRNPDKFDVIVMNLSFYWRSNATNLLSREYLELCRRHLTEGGVVYFNTTGSQDAVYTAAHVFKHVAMFRNFVAASDAPFDMTAEERARNLRRFTGDDGRPLFDGSPALRAKLAELAAFPWTDIRDDMLARPDLWLITDDNMAVEYKVP